jgi:hypothetical protein
VGARPTIPRQRCYTDVGTETDTDTGTETKTDFDAGEDTGNDTGMDTGSDTQTDADTGLDTCRPDAGDTGPDAGDTDTVPPIDAQESVPLGSCSNFAILASRAITNIPASAITGDVGLTPDTGANISGFSDPSTCPEVTGNVYAVDATGPACALIDPVLLANAKTDAEIAFINARAAVRGTPQAISGDLNGLTLYPGLYESGSSLEISPGGFLYLDAQGDGNAVFIIRSATSITTEATSEVVLTNGAKAANVYWTAGSAVTLGTSSIMKGTLLAGTSVSLLTGANLEGRALNQGAAAEAITLDACTITVPSP